MLLFREKSKEKAGLDISELLARTQRLEIRSRHLARSLYSGLYRSAFRGQGIEYAEVREYTEGDDIRTIDWNVSARSNTLHVKKMVEERDRNVLLVLDTSGSLLFGSVRRTKFDLQAEIAALLILSGLYARDRVSLALAGSRVERFIAPAKGSNHATRLIHEIAAQKPRGKVAEMEHLWSFLNSPGIPRSLVLLMTDFEAPIVRSNKLAIAARKHEVVALLVSDPLEWRLPRVGRLRLQDPETGEALIVDSSSDILQREFTRAAQAKRRRLLAALQSSGVDWAEFSTDKDYEAPLRHFLVSRRGYRRR